MSKNSLLSQSIWLIEVKPFGARGEAYDVDEEDADEPPLLLRWGLAHAERSPAGEAETSDVRVVLATGGANWHRRRLRRASADVRSAFSDRSPCLAPGHAPSGQRAAAARSGQAA